MGRQVGRMAFGRSLPRLQRVEPGDRLARTVRLVFS
jgi:hypothetical protein